MTRNQRQQITPAQHFQAVETGEMTIQQRTSVGFRGAPQPNVMYGEQTTNFCGINVTGSRNIVGNTTGKRSDFSGVSITGKNYLVGEHHPIVVEASRMRASPDPQSPPSGNDTRQNEGRNDGVPNSSYARPGQDQKRVPQDGPSKMISDKPHTDSKANKMDIGPEDDWVMA